MTEDFTKKKIRSYGERKIPDELPELPGVEFGKIVGSGFFSHVYNGTFRGKPAAIKLVERGNTKLTLKEIEFLKTLKGTPDVVQLYAAFQTDNMILVFEYVESCTTDYFYNHLSIPRLRFFVKHVLNALKGAHALNIVHRDVKFANVLVSPSWDRISLIDWGCASTIQDSMSSCAGSRNCRSPEMLMGYKGYKTACDCWAVGAMIVDILTEGNLPWKKGNTTDVLVGISRYFGSDGILAISERYEIPINNDVLERLSKEPIKTIESKITERMMPIWTDKLKNLVYGLLQVDPEKRLTIEQATKAKYFFGKKKVIITKEANLQ